MRLLFGVQGTGNGHLSRARAMARALAAQTDIKVDWLFTGRPIEGLREVDMDFMWRRGFTFASRDGRVQYMKTLVSNDLLGFARDIRSIDLTSYDLLVTDYEPVLAWAARRRGLPVIGIGHQYAFNYPVPQAKQWLGNRIMRHFAPVTIPLGLHWHHFGQPVCPPIIDLQPASDTRPSPPPQTGKVLVYLPYENPQLQVSTLQRIRDHRFVIFGPKFSHHTHGNIETRPVSRQSFVDELHAAKAIICNTGFMLISEALALGKHVLTRPLARQVEQLSNAIALEQLDLARIIRRLDTAEIEQWLHHDRPPIRIIWPDVAAAIAKWLAGGDWHHPERVAAPLWTETRMPPQVHQRAQGNDR